MNRNVRLRSGRPLERSAELRRTAGLARTPWSPVVPPLSVSMARTRESKNAPKGRGTSSSGRAESFPPEVAALIDARDGWCIHCGTPFDLHRHHRRIKGSGGDPRPHTDCACNAARICRSCHEWAHSGNGRREAEAEGLIIPRATLEPWTESVLVHLEGGGLRKFPTCDGRWADYPSEVAA